MLIALFGGMGFLCYLILNYQVAIENGALIKEIGSVKFPILQKVAEIKRNVAFNKDALGKLIGLEDLYYIEDADSINVDIEASFKSVLSYKDSNVVEIKKIEALYHGYYVDARKLSFELMKDADNADRYMSRVVDLNRQYRFLMDQLESLQIFYTRSYIESLALADSSQKEAIRSGLILGGGMIFVLVILAWTIANLVCRAVLKSDLIKDQFLATISHELRTPMNGVTGSLELLKMIAPKDGEIAEYVSTATDSASEMMNLVDDLLEYTEALSGNLIMSNNRFNLKLKLALLSYSYKNICEKKNIKFEFDLNSIPDYELIGDDKRLVMVIRSLLDNSVKFTDNGSVKLDLTVIEKDQESTFYFKVIDTGVGIDSKHVREIYTSFRQVDGSFSRRHGGLGIGLATSSIVAKLLGGKLSFESELGVGSEFTLMMPLRKAPSLDNITRIDNNVQCDSVLGVAPENQLPENSDRSLVPLAANEAVCFEQVEPIKGWLLVVEDNIVNQKVLSAHLKKLGHDVVVAENGKVALEALENQQFQCVFMDCQMPVMDGFDATRNIRESSESYATIPIVAVTANVMSTDRQKCLDAGMDDYVQKPYNRETIKLMLETYVYDYQDQSIDPQSNVQNTITRGSAD